MHIKPDLYKRIIQAKLYIDEKYHEAIDLDEIARKAYLSKFHFHRLFTSVYKLTPHRYLTRKRIDKASVLLEKEELTVMEVCNSVGFESIGSFSTLFKKKMGYAPQYYRNMAFHKQEQARQHPRRFIPHCFIDTFRMDDQKSNSQE